MIKTRFTALLSIGALAVLAIPLLAHHSGTMFEKEKTITVEGVVKEFQYTNPHSWLKVDVKNKDGSVTTWGFEAEGPSTLQRSGIKPRALQGTRTFRFESPCRDGPVFVLHIHF